MQYFKCCIFNVFFCLRYTKSDVYITMNKEIQRVPRTNVYGIMSNYQLALITKTLVKQRDDYISNEGKTTKSVE